MVNENDQNKQEEKQEVEEKKEEPEEEATKEKKVGLFHRECKHCAKHKKETDEYKTGWQRALADYRNLQKEIEDRKSDWLSMSELQILEEFIPIYDNFKKAFNNKQLTINLPTGQADNEQDSWAIGIQYIMKQFGDVLRAHGVEEIKTAGEKFDLKFHEAVGEEVAEGVEPHAILREVEGGYTMRGRVVKAARVVVARE